MQSDADPCVDFYRYACGRFAEQHQRRPGETYLFLRDLQAESPYVQLAKALDEEARSSAGSASEKALSQYYASCMDRVSIDREGFQALAPLRRQIANATTPAEFGRVLAALAEARSMPLFRAASATDPQKTSRQILELTPPALTLPTNGSYLRSGEADQAILGAYRMHVQRVLLLYGFSPGRAASASLGIQEIETALAKSALSAVAARDPKNQHHILSADELRQLVPGLDWKTFFAGLGLDTPEQVNVVAPASLATLQQFFSKREISKLRVYLVFRLIESTPLILQPSTLAEENRSFGKIIATNYGATTSSESCAVETARARPDDAVRLFLREFTPKTLKTDVTALVEEIEAQMKLDIERADWMSPETKEAALRKLSQLTSNIAYPDLNGDYSSVPVREKHALQNYLAAADARFRKQMAKVGGPTDRFASHLGPLTIGAEYDEDLNEIELPAAFLLPPTFDAQAPRAENYGRIGFSTGHEIVHGYDDKGRQYDGIGRLADWWTKEDTAHFEKRASCFVSEYGNFAMDEDHHINGRLTLGENIADNGGLHLALAAFLADAAKRNVDVNVPDNGYTSLQRFFLSYAQDSCSSVDSEAERVQVESNPHTLDRFRANGVLQNTPEFGQAFSCSKGQPMMPVETCRIW